MFSRDQCLNLLSSRTGEDSAALTLLQTIGFEDPTAALGRPAKHGGHHRGCQSCLRPRCPRSSWRSRMPRRPTGSLMNLERLTQVVADRQSLYRFLAEQPRAVEMLVRLFVGSQFLTEILLRSPHYLAQLVEHKRVCRVQVASRSDRARRVRCSCRVRFTPANSTRSVGSNNGNCSGCRPATPSG